MKFFIIAAALNLPCALALPSDSGDGHSLLARDKPKLNQYRTMDDWSGNCYDLDKQTDAFFDNTAGFIFSEASKDIGCNGVGKIGLRGGACMEKGDFKSVVFR
ncbi:hypothetical protein JX265_009608 [Neoarthrinium moseri]|uniref:Uncharacterized protein n=1 Tax=Neoarthrinium moseri TaxID=1658444 RepID=A0A9P9WG82_9PEZI|nr:hypothetical protein JX265_009608 [Neoarthrinium moseri]